VLTNLVSILKVKASTPTNQVLFNISSNSHMNSNSQSFNMCKEKAPLLLGLMFNRRKMDMPE